MEKIRKRDTRTKSKNPWDFASDPPNWAEWLKKKYIYMLCRFVYLDLFDGYVIKIAGPAGNAQSPRCVFFSKPTALMYVLSIFSIPLRYRRETRKTTNSYPNQYSNRIYLFKWFRCWAQCDTTVSDDEDDVYLLWLWFFFFSFFLGQMKSNARDEGRETNDETELRNGIIFIRFETLHIFLHCTL